MNAHALPLLPQSTKLSIYWCTKSISLSILNLHSQNVITDPPNMNSRLGHRCGFRSLGLICVYWQDGIHFPSSSGKREQRAPSRQVSREFGAMRGGGRMELSPSGSCNAEPPMLVLGGRARWSQLKSHAANSLPPWAAHIFQLLNGYQSSGWLQTIW